MDWMLLPLRRYAVFRGRSRRKEFWLWVVFVVIVSVVLSLIDRALGLGGGGGATREVTPNGFAYAAGLHGGLLTGLFALGIFLPNLALQVRRLHDVNRSGWWLLLPVLPYVLGATLTLVAAFGAARGGGLGGLALIGGLTILVGLVCAALLLVWFCLDGTRGPNRFGEDPKRIGADLRDVFE